MKEGGVEVCLVERRGAGGKVRRGGAGEEVKGGGVEVCSVEGVTDAGEVEGREVAVCSEERGEIDMEVCSEEDGNL